MGAVGDATLHMRIIWESEPCDEARAFVAEEVNRAVVKLLREDEWLTALVRRELVAILQERQMLPGPEPRRAFPPSVVNTLDNEPQIGMGGRAPWPTP